MLDAATVDMSLLEAEERLEGLPTEVQLWHCRNVTRRKEVSHVWSGCNIDRWRMDATHVVETGADGDSKSDDGVGETAKPAPY